MCFDGNWHGLLSQGHIRACSVYAFVGHLSLPSGLNHHRSSIATECIRGLASLGLITPVLVQRALVICADVEVIVADVHITSVVRALRVDVSNPVLHDWGEDWS